MAKKTELPNPYWVNSGKIKKQSVTLVDTASQTDWPVRNSVIQIDNQTQTDLVICGLTSVMKTCQIKEPDSNYKAAEMVFQKLLKKYRGQASKSSSTEEVKVSSFEGKASGSAEIYEMRVMVTPKKEGRLGVKSSLSVLNSSFSSFDFDSDNSNKTADSIEQSTKM